MTDLISADPHEAALFIRAFEKALLDLHKQGLISGTVHTCVGQEAIPLAIHAHLCPGLDAFFATHRGHGHFLAHGGAPEALLSEMMGRKGALCEGRGGSQHLCYERFFSNGIQGAGTLQAVGYALAHKLRNSKGIAVAQLGDGTLGQGAVYEAMNFAALLKVPVLFLIEYNGWAQSTDVRTTIAGTIEGRAAAFGLPCDRRDDLDQEALRAHFEKVVECVRAGQPWVQIVETRRLLAHSKGDDNRPLDLIQAQFAIDPLETWLNAHPAQAEPISSRVDQRLAACIAEVSARPPLSDLGGSSVPDLNHPIGSEGLVARLDGRNRGGTVLHELNVALHNLLHEDDRVVVLGEDIADPYGGAFKVTQGLSTTFGDRVFSTPIAENAIVGVAAGAALAGMRPIAEIMFADFVTLAVDQLANSAAKFYYMFGGKVRCPLTLRLVSGGGRGYGPTHSQSTERLFCGEPGLRVVALSCRHDPGSLLKHVVLHDDAPTIFVEDKSLYGRRPLLEPPLGMCAHHQPGSAASYPPLLFVPVNETAVVTVVAYGASAEIAERALENLLLEYELYGDLIVLSQLWPLDEHAIIDSVRRTRRLLVIEPSVTTYGVGAAVARATIEALELPFRFRSMGARPYPIPSARVLEEQVLPTMTEAVRLLRELLDLPCT